ncbi:caspase domain-containing protein [Rhodocollybia butyracea]|uniref:Caspase domain-containing protein n=1 Tax=Rhodocollybia butyracea TaxID=206335 RepID=A0A9P5U8P0_9AGAR|nr:caspase domain-containing protein [Rhodocollybia butyracea]
MGPCHVSPRITVDNIPSTYKPSWLDNVTISNIRDLLFQLLFNPPPGVSYTEAEKRATEAAYRKYMHKPKPTRPPQLNIVEASAVSKSLFAVIIGVNEYAHEGVKNLNGAVPDADMFSEFLTSTLGVPPIQITNLRDGGATKKSIEDAITNLGGDKIPEDAALLIFFAGHGAEVDAPANYPSGHVKGKIQMLLPHDFTPQAKTDEITHGQGLLDIEFARLLRELALKKSNNITVIVDSCHSGSCTRSYLLDDPKLAVRGVDLPDNFVIAVQQLVNDFMTEDETRAYAPAAGYETVGRGSHMLLAGSLFRDYGVDKLTYVDVIDKLPDLPAQHPQCEGAHKTRILFDGQIHSTQVLYKLSSDKNSNELTLEGGEAHGITTGAEFALYEDDKMEKSLGTVTVASCAAFSSVCVPKDLGPSLPTRAFAKLIRVGDCFDVRLLIPMHDDFLRPIRRVALEMESGEEGKKRFCMVDRMDESPDLIFTLENRHIYFEIGDRVCREYGVKRMSTSLPLPIQGPTMDTISRMLLSSADFYWHLRRSNREHILSSSGKVTVNCVRLIKSLDDTFIPDSQGADFNVNGVIAVNVDERFEYGFKINNKSNVPLYAALFFFDIDDLSITEFYVPGRGKSSVADASVPPGGILTIGYGPSDTVPHTFHLKEGQDVSVGYLKLFLSNKYVDFSYIQQSTPFASSRGVIRPPTRTKDLYEAICITLIQKRGPVIAKIPPTRPIADTYYGDTPQPKAAVPQRANSFSQSELQDPTALVGVALPSTDELVDQSAKPKTVVPHRSNSLPEPDTSGVEEAAVAELPAVILEEVGATKSQRTPSPYSLSSSGSISSPTLRQQQPQHPSGSSHTSTSSPSHQPPPKYQSVQESIPYGVNPSFSGPRYSTPSAHSKAYNHFDSTPLLKTPQPRQLLSHLESSFFESQQQQTQYWDHSSPISSPLLSSQQMPYPQGFESFPPFQQQQQAYHEHSNYHRGDASTSPLSRPAYQNYLQMQNETFDSYGPPSSPLPQQVYRHRSQSKSSFGFPTPISPLSHHYRQQTEYRMPTPQTETYSPGPPQYASPLYASPPPGYPIGESSYFNFDMPQPTQSSFGFSVNW